VVVHLVDHKKRTSEDSEEGKRGEYKELAKVEQFVVALTAPSVKKQDE
jgi:hypothetical protein